MKTILPYYRLLQEKTEERELKRTIKRFKKTKNRRKFNQEARV